MNAFIEYLNGLHNYYAQNQNAYGERNISSPFYHQTMVPIDVCKHICRLIEKEAPHIIILTGHAGDGKTSIMYQVLEQLGADTIALGSEQEVKLENGKQILCIKDFSEFTDTKKLEVLKKAMQYPSKGYYVFMVSNTGPLINTFGGLGAEVNDSEKIKMELIERLDENNGDVKDLYGQKMCILNIAAIDNTNFANKFLDKILNEELWCECAHCCKKDYCHVLRNHDLIIENKEKVKGFIENYYMWQTEYGQRLTIRSMAEHIAYMITGGDGCDDIYPSIIHEKLFTNLFFGYEGIVKNPLAENIIAVKLARDSGIYLRRLRADEELLIRRNYNKIFSKAVNEIIASAENPVKLSKDFDDELRRMYLFLNILPEEQQKKDLEDIFSSQFMSYIAVRNKGQKPTKSQRLLVIDALRMIYRGTIVRKDNIIPITMGSEEGIMQSVQLIAGKLNTSDIELLDKIDSKLNSERKKIILKIKQKEICIINLPMFDHFEELKKGVIATDLDPQLSRGLENLKSSLLELADKDDDKLELLIMRNDGPDSTTLEIEDGYIIVD